MKFDEDARLWTMLLFPPLAWGAHLQTVYALHQQACEWKSTIVPVVVSLVFLVAVGYSGWRAHARMPAHVPDPRETATHSRAHFMATSAYIGAWLFGLVIAGQTLPLVFLRPCD